MKAVRYHGIHDIRCEDIPVPRPEADEVLIKVSYAGICGSDLHIYNRGMFIQNIPETMGHEFVGSVESVGSSVTRFRPGDTVVGNPMVTCGKCPACLSGMPNCCSSLGFIGEVRQGCFAEYICLPADMLALAAPSHECSCDPACLALAEPLAVALNVLERLDPDPDDRLAVIGTGPIGLLCILAASVIYKVSSVTAVNRSQPRLGLAGRLGASETLQSLPDDSSFTHVIEAAGGEASFASALAHTAPGGTLCMVSIFEDDLKVDLNAIVASQINVTGANAYEHRHIEEAVSLIADGTLDPSPVITGIYDLSQCQEAFDLLCSSDKTAAKLLFKI